MLLHSVHKSIITSQRRNVLFIIKDITFLTTASSAHPPRRLDPACGISSCLRWFSSLSDERTKDETIIATTTTTSHDGINNNEPPPLQILPTKRSGRKRNYQQQEQQRDNNTSPLRAETPEFLSRAIWDKNCTAPTGADNMSVMMIDNEEEVFSQVLPNEQRRRRLDVAIVGLPNAGKSQLLNVLTQSPVAAVSRKRHTTRHGGILGARTVVTTEEAVTTTPRTTTEQDQLVDDDHSSAATTGVAEETTVTSTTHQLVFVDTPGFMQVSQAKKEGLDGALVSTAANVIQNVDFTLLVVDAAARLADKDSRREAIVALMLQALSSQGRHEEQMQLLNDDDDDDDDDTTYVNDDDKVHENQQQQPLLRQENHSKFAVVLNKVDLVHPKSRLLDMAIDISAMAKECIKYHHHHHQDRRLRSSLVHGEHDDDDDDYDTHDDYRQTKLPLSTKQKIRDISSSSSSSSNVDSTDHAGDDIDDGDDDDDPLQDEMPMFFYISALKQDGVDDLLQHLLTLTTPTYEEWPVEPGQATQLSDLDRVEEIIREKLYRCLHKEVPYAIQQENRLYDKRQVPTATASNTSTSPNGSTRQATTMTTILTIHQDLRVWTRSHRELVRGRGDQTLERIRETATRDLEQVFNCMVQLHLNVKLVKSKNDRQW